MLTPWTTFEDAGVEGHTGDEPSIAKRIAASASGWSTPSIAITLSRPRSPRRIVRQVLRTPSTRASSWHTASFARPSRGGAVTRTMTTPSRSPTNTSDRDRGCTRTQSVARAISSSSPNCTTEDQPGPSVTALQPDDRLRPRIAGCARSPWRDVTRPSRERPPSPDRVQRATISAAPATVTSESASAERRS